THLHTQGTTHYIEIGPDTTLTTLNTHTLTNTEPTPTLTHTLHPKHTPTHTLTTTLLSAPNTDWNTVLPPAPHTPLPTYAFQHQAFWLNPAVTADVTSAGLEATDHPLLGAATPLPDGGYLFTGRLSVAAHGWLADHAVMDTALLPGTAYVDLALHAALYAGCGGVKDLTLYAPMTVPRDDAVQVQVSVGAAEEGGERPVAMHARPAGTDEGTPWVRHAAGTLAAAVGAPREFPSTWPPQGAVAVPVEDVYPQLGAIGLDYGPAFQGLRAAWRAGDDLYAEVALPEGAAVDGFGVHPALLDAALHVSAARRAADVEGVRDRDDQDAGDGAPLHLPFSWSGVTLHSTGANVLRVRLSRTGDESLALAATDPAGTPVVTVETLAVRPVDADQLRPADDGAPRDALFELEWVPAGALPADGDRTVAVLGAPLVHAPGQQPLPVHADLDALVDAVTEGRAAAPDVLLAVLPCEVAADAVATVTADALTLAQQFVSLPQLDGTRMTFVTHGATTTNLAQAGVVGLVRTAQSEYPHRFTLVDLDTPPSTTPLTPELLGHLASELPQTVLRDGVPHVPRLVAARPENEGTAGTPIDPDGTILITGGTGTLGSLVAR
ncbi:polyketide synthase dehydratase domain-containing protein, partial [Streptomyces sp. NPDC020917]|uniref:polyketide synthase dehydratase domain-containing protein n=1 Tax=Streptomyces sp. NPDC020917 TaxID=3365102 RepID=UPI00379609BA